MWLSGGEHGGEQMTDRAVGDVFDLDVGTLTGPGAPLGWLARYEVRRDAESSELQAIFVGTFAKVGG